MAMNITALLRHHLLDGVKGGRWSDHLICLLRRLLGHLVDARGQLKWAENRKDQFSHLAL
jgi:hypothetical protein